MNRVNTNRSADAYWSRPLHIACLVKQVPVAESLTLGPDGRLQRRGMALEMNPYCRRAVAKGVELANASGGSCIVYTLGPISAEDVVREAVAWGADKGIVVSDPVLAGSDTLATAQALSAALRLDGPFDLILVGRNSIDGDTGQVGPEVAELMGMPFAAGVRHLSFSEEMMRLGLEYDDGSVEVEMAMPALLSVAERLCDPCKVDADGRHAVPADLIVRRTIADLGPGPWGEEASRTRVGVVRPLTHTRVGKILSGDVGSQVEQAVAFLIEREALGAVERPLSQESDALVSSPLSRLEVRQPEPAPRPSVTSGPEPQRGSVRGPRPMVAVLVEPDRPAVTAELLCAAQRMAQDIYGVVVALVPGDGDPMPDGSVFGALGADEIVVFEGDPIEEDVAAAVVSWASGSPLWALIAPSTAFGREVVGRAAAALSVGLVGDAISLDVVDQRMVAAKPAFSGALVADITCTSAIQMATVRPGVLPVGPPRHYSARVSRRTLMARDRVKILGRRRDDDVEVLARAEVVIGLGSGVSPAEYSAFSPLVALLGAELGATRRVTDRGWMPRSRQIGITGRSIAPRLYVAVGLSGKFNHMVGVRSAGTILAVNADPGAPVFAQADLGIVADWHDALPLLNDALRVRVKVDGGSCEVRINAGGKRHGGLV